MLPTKNDLPGQTREAMIRLLNARLADVIDLGTQAKQAHWNVKGPTFIALHELFDEIHGVVAGHTDTIGERATALGGVALGTVSEVTSKTTLPAYPTDITSGKDHVEALSSAIATFGKAAREAIDTADDAGDKDTADLFTAISRDMDKYLWFLESHLQK